MQHTKVQIGDKSLLPEIEKRVLLPEVDGQVGQVLAKGPDGTTVWTEGIDRSRLLPALDSIPVGRNGNPVVFRAVSEGMDEHTLLYMPCEDYKDHSQYLRTVTQASDNSIAIDVSDKKFGAASLHGNGSNRAGVIAELPVAPFAADTTVHTWVKITDADDRCGIFDTYGAADGGSGDPGKGVGGIALWTHQGKLKAYKASAHFSSYWYDDDSGNLLVEADLPSDYLNRWMHVALVRSGLNWILFVDGVKLAENIKDFTPNKKFIRLAQHQSNAMTGNLDEFIILDYARWITDFEPPTQPATTLTRSYEISEQPTGTVKSVNNQLPDEAGNVTVETGSTVDESRLLPTGAKDGDLLIKSAEIVGNDYNDGHTVLFIQGSTSNAAAADTPLPVTWNNQPAVQEDNTLLLTGSTQLSTASAPEVKRVFGGEFTVEAYLKPTQFNNTSRQDTNFFYLNGPSTYYIYLSNYNNSGNAENGKFGLWVYSGNRQIILNNEEFHHVALDVYMEGTTRKYTIYYDGVAVQTDTWYNDGVADSTNAIIRFFSNSDGAELNNCYLKSIRVSDIARYKGKSFTPPANGLYLPAPDGEWVAINRSNFVEQTDHKLNPEPTTVDETKYGFSPALKKDADTETFAYEMPSKANDVPADSTLQLNNSGTPVFVEAEKVLLNDAKNVKLNQLDPTRQLPATTTNSVTPVYKKQDVIGAMYNDSKVVVLLQGSKTNTAKNAAFQLTGGDEVTVDSDGNLVFNRGNGIIVPSGKFNNEANGQFTVDIMLAVDQLPSGSGNYEYIFGNDNSPIYPFNYRVFGDGTVRFQYQNTNHNIQIEKGIFALLSFDYDGTTLRSYKDGVLVGAQDITYSAFPNTIGIGTDQYYQHTGFAGRIKYIRMSNIARYRGQAFTPPGLAGYITPPDGEWVTTPAIGDNRLLPNNPTNGDIPVYTNDFDKSNFNTTDTVCLLQNAGVNQFDNVAKGKIGGSSINNYGGSVTIDENGYFVYPGGSGTWIEFIASGWNASGNGSWTIDVRMIAEATGSSQYFLGPANDGSGDPQAVIRGSGPTGTIQPYELSDMIHDITFGEEFTYTMAWDAPTKTLRTWKDGKQMRKRTFTSNGYQFGFKGATEFWLGRNAVDPGLKGKVKYWRLSNAALYGDSEFTPPTDVYQDAPAGAWELVNRSELGGTSTEVDLSNYSAANIKLTGTTKIELNAGTGTALQIATESGDAFRTTFKTSGLWSADIAGYLTAIHGGMQMDIYADSNQADVRIYAGGSPSSGSGNGNILLYGSDIKFNGNALNSANGLVKAEAGKLPALDGSNLTNLPGGSVDLSSYTGKINLTSANDQTVSIKFNSGNPSYNAIFTMGVTGVEISGYGDVKLAHTGGSYLNLGSGATTLNSTGSMQITAQSRIVFTASEGIYLGAAGPNTAGGVAVVDSTTGKLKPEIIPTATAAIKRAYIPIPEGDNGASIQELFVELKFSKTGDFTDSVDVTMLNAAAAMSGITTVVEDGGNSHPEAVVMTNAGVPPEFFGTVLVLNVTQLGPGGLNLLDGIDGYVAAYRWRATYDDNTTNSTWRVLSL